MESFGMTPSMYPAVFPPLEPQQQLQQQLPLMQQPMETPVPWMLTIPSNIPWSQPCYSNSQMTFTAKPVDSRPLQIKRRATHLDSTDCRIVGWQSWLDPCLNFDVPKVMKYTRNLKRNYLVNKNDEIAPPPSKMYISEEKMIARMKELNLNIESSDISESIPELEAKKNVSFQEIESRLEVDFDDEIVSLPSTSKDSVLILSKELRESLPDPDPILPQPILKQLQKPSMEVVLWKPPGGLVSNLIKSNTRKSRQQKGFNSNPLANETRSTMSIINNNSANNNRDENYSFLGKRFLVSPSATRLQRNLSNPENQVEQMDL